MPVDVSSPVRFGALNYQRQKIAAVLNKQQLSNLDKSVRGLSVRKGGTVQQLDEMGYDVLVTANPDPLNEADALMVGLTSKGSTRPYTQSRKFFGSGDKVALREHIVDSVTSFLRAHRSGYFLPLELQVLERIAGLRRN